MLREKSWVTVYVYCVVLDIVFEFCEEAKLPQRLPAKERRLAIPQSKEHVFLNVLSDSRQLNLQRHTNLSEYITPADP